ncbi:Putative Flagellin, Flp1-like, domain [Amphibacillus marinus]|uniref:Putative Flagellin, Flp1-like, domain n=1 Tax=Amphibacillus marinus TaxID=872970 RepID=A0A1H8R315_9BACI|nr:Flp1 family type IVb pilin [Amphibacillus marinus]SEO60687.1 Putative Flagellin, Flp1-like, domain [Amphibacillus marinus]
MNYLQAKFLNFLQDEEGLGTLEILLIIVVLVAVALMFSEQLTTWVQGLLDNIGNQLPGN